MRVVVVGCGRVEGIGFDRDVLERAGVARSDALVAVTGGDNSNVVATTGDDEDHLVVSLLVKRWNGVPRVVAWVNNPKNTWLFTADWGVDTAVSAPAVMTWLLERAVGVQDVVALLRAERGRGVARSS